MSVTIPLTPEVEGAEWSAALPRTVKTKTSVRTVEIPDVVAGPLADHVAQGVTPVSVDDDTDHRNPVRREALLLFRGASGEALNAATFSRTWATARAAV